MQNFISTTQQVTFQAEIEHGFLTADVNDHLILSGHLSGGSEEGIFYLNIENRKIIFFYSSFYYFSLNFQKMPLQLYL